MKLVDVHAHLDDERIFPNLDNIIKEAKEKGQKVIITSGVNPKTNRAALSLSEKYDIVKPSFGFYPIDSIAERINNFNLEEEFRKITSFSLKEEMEWVEKNKDKCVAIGEIGMDFQIAPSYKEEQRKVFEELIMFAKKIDKPVVIHSRKAELECIEILEKFGVKKVLMHCFGGKKSLVKRCVANGWFLSVPPVLIRLEHFRMMAELVPLENILTETDAPYLSPIKGEINIPQNVEISINEIARIKNIDREEVSEKIFQNARLFFGKMFF